MLQHFNCFFKSLKNWQTRYLFWFQLLFYLATIVIVVLSLLPGDKLPVAAGYIWDKAAHSLSFFGLMAFGALAYGNRQLLVALGLMLLGGAIEIMQSLTTWRKGEWWDWLADGIGIIIFLVGALICSSLLKMIRNGKWL